MMTSRHLPPMMVYFLLAALAFIGGITPVTAQLPGSSIPPTFPVFTPRAYDAGAHHQLVRICPATYDGDGSTMMTNNGANPRAVSNAVARCSSAASANGLSNMVWAWGQFIDHDIDLSEQNSAIPMSIEIPPNDPVFPAACSAIPTRRSMAVGGSGAGDPLEQINAITPFLDGSGVYGSDAHRAEALRSFQHGKLKTSSDGQLLPFNDGSLNNEGGQGGDLFVAGDVRVNEQVGLTAMHTLFVREHNRLCDVIQAKYFPDAADSCDASCDENIYQLARRIVSATIQKITYEEFLPTLLGAGNAPSYSNGGYDGRDASIRNEFSTAAFRFGHSMVSPNLRQGLQLRNAFFQPGMFANNPALVDDLLLSLVNSRAREIDTCVTEELRSFLFNQPDTDVCLDLVALNIQRGRDHGIPPCNVVRQEMGLAPHATFASITTNGNLAQKLSEAYGGDVNMVDAWVCGLAEDHVPGGSLGELNTAVIKFQFEQLMYGDPLFYRWDPILTDGTTLEGIIDVSKDCTLSAIIMKNTKHRGDPKRNVFSMNDHGGTWGDPHFKSWDGEIFDFHGECDLVLGDAPSFANGLGLAVHVRTTIRFDYSYIESAVIQIGKETFQLSSWGEYFLNSVNSAEMPANATISGYSITHKLDTKKKHIYSIQLSQASKIDFIVFKDLVRVDWDICESDASDFVDMLGLLGPFGNGTHLARDGTTVLKDPKEYGREWQVRSDMDPLLFDELRPPQYPAKCIMPDLEFQTSSLRRRLASGISADQASAACGHVVEERMHAMCVSDVLATQDLSVAEGAY